MTVMQFIFLGLFSHLLFVFFILMLFLMIVKVCAGSVGELVAVFGKFTVKLCG